MCTLACDGAVSLCVCLTCWLLGGGFSVPWKHSKTPKECGEKQCACLRASAVHVLHSPLCRPCCVLSTHSQP